MISWANRLNIGCVDLKLLDTSYCSSKIRFTMWAMRSKGEPGMSRNKGEKVVDGLGVALVNIESIGGN